MIRQMVYLLIEILRGQRFLENNSTCKSSIKKLINLTRLGLKVFIAPASSTAYYTRTGL